MGLDLTESVTVEAGIPTLLDVSATASAKESFFTTGSHELSENHVETKDITVDWTVGARRKAVYTSQWLDSKVVDLPYSGELVLTFKDGSLAMSSQVRAVNSALEKDSGTTALPL